MKNNLFEFIPLGGLGEVGMNCSLFKFGEQKLVIDAGILFADSNDFGIEAILPDFWSLIDKEAPQSWFITHAHEDHIGALPFAFKVAQTLKKKMPQVYLPELAYWIVKEKLKEEPSLKWETVESSITILEAGETVEIGDLKVKSLKNRHSTLDTCSLAFEWQHKENESLKMLHTGDFKLDYHEFEDGVLSVSDLNPFKGDECDFLFIDSTNSPRDGQSVSEKEIWPYLSKAIENHDGRIFATLFSSNLYRIASLIHIGQKHGKKVALVGRSMQQIFRIARERGLFEKYCPKFSFEDIVEADQINQFPLEKQLVLCSGSQGEIRSVLWKLSMGTHHQFRIQENDLILFSSKTIPGNEKPVGRLVNQLMKAGAKIIEGDNSVTELGGPIHASGHGRSVEVSTVMEELRAKNVVPVHGEYRHLFECSRLASKVSREKSFSSRQFVVTNGDHLSFEFKNGNWVKKSLKNFEGILPKFLRFENQYTFGREDFLRERKRAALGGVVSIVVEGVGSKIDIKLRGVFPKEIVFDDREEQIKKDLREWVLLFIGNKKKKQQFDPYSESLAKEMTQELERYLKKLLQTRALAVVHLLP